MHFAGEKENEDVHEVKKRELFFKKTSTIIITTIQQLLACKCRHKSTVYELEILVLSEILKIYNL
jgi:hypothetical protein